MMLRLLVVCLCFVAAARSITAPAQCAHVTDAEFTCDYSEMDAGEHPIDFTAFDPKPQQLHVTVNGIVPYIGEHGSCSNYCVDNTKNNYTCNAMIIKKLALMVPVVLLEN
ncbi:hypothetical protein DPMN_160157 [Dreissena polymorpha]|uniref:Uncharacterized protein n=1 Tax=Dreissena polymorpha TaxID=45954 RepID=A0A9D4ELS3_DREPO|nr:hypothetical protein DPMN_160157 [Dreissena polymorpha]